MTSQITPAEADALLDTLVLSTQRGGWDALVTADKQVLLNRAQAMIDAGQWKGRRYDESQDYAFPRLDDDDNLIGEDADPDPLAPLPVREALALLAWSLIDRADIWSRREAIAGGLAGQGTAGLSEAYVPAGGASQVKADLSVVGQVWSRLAGLWRVGGTLI